MNSRTKGHNFERLVATFFQKLGYRAYTTRSASKRLDDCGIDIIGTPFIIQCKAGYDNKPPKFEVEYAKAMTSITQMFGPESEKLIRKPYLLFYKKDLPKGVHRRGNEYTTVTMTMEDFHKIILDEEYKKDVLSILS